MEIADYRMAQVLAQIWEVICQKNNVERNVLKQPRVMRLNLKRITGDVYVMQAMDRPSKHPVPIMEQSAM